jgi:hypothetical protein
MVTVPEVPPDVWHRVLDMLEKSVLDEIGSGLLFAALIGYFVIPKILRARKGQ